MPCFSRVSPSSTATEPATSDKGCSMRLAVTTTSS
ncbi:Uncharacterised protein [Vibrio cholerae]|nr:Uncharacterised protein [Vibrio cholerae]